MKNESAKGNFRPPGDPQPEVLRNVLAGFMMSLLTASGVTAQEATLAYYTCDTDVVENQVRVVGAGGDDLAGYRETAEVGHPFRPNHERARASDNIRMSPRNSVQPFRRPGSRSADHNIARRSVGSSELHAASRPAAVPIALITNNRIEDRSIMPTRARLTSVRHDPSLARSEHPMSLAKAPRSKSSRIDFVPLQETTFRSK